MEKSPDRPTLSPSQKSAAAFWLLMHQVALVAGVTHLAFMALFYALGAHTLALVNVFSVMLFAASWVCLRQRMNIAAVTLIVSEIVLHAVLAVRTIGWDSGFHYYLLVVAPVLMVSRLRVRWIRPLALTSLMALYIGLDHGLRHTTPQDTLSAPVLEATRWFNIVCTFLLLAYLAHTYLVLVQRAERTLHQLATTDPLTQLLNRRSLMDLAETACVAAESAQRHATLAFVLADIDHFKAINDRHGHAAGDAVLVTVSDVLRQAVRQEDSVARWGGEEFLILMPGADLQTAQTVAERLRQEVAAIEVPFEGRMLHVSITLGVSGLRQGDTLDDPVHRADAALYRGKMAGRNQVVADEASA